MSHSRSKRKASRLLSLVLAVGLAAAGVGPVHAAASFTDTNHHWAQDTIAWAASEHIVSGYGDGTFRPDAPVSEPEFLAMLIRTFPEAGTVTASTGSTWYSGYYKLAYANNWMVTANTSSNTYNRGNVAQLIVSTQGEKLGLTQAVQYLLDHHLSKGKTAATVAGYEAGDSLTRAEAVQFLRNAKEEGLALSAAQVSTASMEVRGIAIGASEQSVLSELGQPQRKDLSLYGFAWYVYNKDPANYTLIGISNGKVAGLYTSGSDWDVGHNITPAFSRTNVVSKIGDPLQSILKGNTYYQLNDVDKNSVYKLDGRYVTFYYDSFNSNQIEGIEIIDGAAELAVQGYGKPSDSLRQSYEREVFDLANAARVKRGLKPFVWDDTLASVSRAHSKDMAVNNYFDHTDLQGGKPWDRGTAAGLDYAVYAENIAAGQQDAIAAHHAWMNSEGHRHNLLSDVERLGVGVYFGGEYSVYYTQNFYTPR